MSMLNKIKLKNEEIISNYLQNVFDDSFKIKTDWGFPITKVTINSDLDSKKSTWELTFNLLAKNFNISTINSKTEEEGLEVPEWGSIDSSTINYIIDTTIAITEQLFTTRPQDTEEEKTEEPDEESEAIEPDEIIEA